MALVGRSGSGKTTTAHLLMRFWDPNEGRILLGGHDLRDSASMSCASGWPWFPGHLSVQHHRARQSAHRPTGGNEGIDRAAREANAHEFIAHLPDGYDTMIGERGVQLSADSASGCRSPEPF